MSIILSYPFATSLLSSTLRCCVRSQCPVLVRDFLASSISPPPPVSPSIYHVGPRIFLSGLCTQRGLLLSTRLGNQKDLSAMW